MDQARGGSGEIRDGLKLARRFWGDRLQRVARFQLRVLVQYCVERSSDENGIDGQSVLVVNCQLSTFDIERCAWVPVARHAVGGRACEVGECEEVGKRPRRGGPILAALNNFDKKPGEAQVGLRSEPVNGGK